MELKEVLHSSFGRCLELSNGIATLVITIDLGPRIISYSLCGKDNIFMEDTKREVFNDKDELHSFFSTNENWYIYGGHRLWTSPESFPESYFPDNDEVSYTYHDGILTLTPPPRTKIGEQHVMTVKLDENSARVTVGHIIKNIGDKPITLSPWCMTVVSKGGTQIMPVCRRKTGLLSNRRMVIWEYTDIADERFFLGNRYMTLKQTPCEKAFKIGVNNEDGWTAYVNKEQLFIKQFAFNDSAAYPDYEVNFETYTNNHIMEIETLGELVTLAPGDSTQADERWFVKECYETPDARDEEKLDAFVKKYVEL